ncbi:chymotrypsin inhibitor-like [Anastrepha obliqua]|uniref:chymotrypsin inhibitor-like n=1 Tax=Anastrepha obliqua TaxID=95512 RepID=UPI0024091E5E|nr:chymotrypsin inhibitor-like [Anastrepha obliqua]
MNNKICLIFALTLCFIAFISAKPQTVLEMNEDGSCGENQVFRGCGSACTPKCSNRDEVIYCTQQCLARCECKDDYLVNLAGKCVAPKDC